MSSPQSAVDKPRRVRAPRRNYEKEFSALQAYVQASIDVLEAAPLTEFGGGQVAAFKNVLRRMEVKK